MSRARSESVGRPKPCPPVTLLVDPEDHLDCVREISALDAPHAGVVVCHPTPSSSGRFAVARDLLAALGKPPQALTGEDSLQRDLWQLVRRWMRAESVRHLVVLRAHRLGRQRWEELITLTDDIVDRLWLVSHRPTLAAQHRDLLTELGLPPVGQPWQNALHDLREQTASSRSKESAVNFPAAPTADFPTFRATARRLLEPAAFATLDNVYRAGFKNAQLMAQKWPRGRETFRADGANLIQQLTIQADSADEVLTIIRATQAAFFGEGLLIRAQLNPHLSERSRTPTAPRLPAHVVSRIRLIALPVAAAALTLGRAIGLSNNELLQLQVKDLEDVGNDGVYVQTSYGVFRVHSAACAPLRALSRGRQARKGEVGSLPLFDMDNVVDRSNPGVAMPAARLSALCSNAAMKFGVEDTRELSKYVEVTNVDAPMELR